MSGFDTPFKIWLDKKAGHVIYKSKKKKIQQIFFTSSQIANSDEMNFKLSGKIITKGEGIDFKELWNRFYKETGEKKPKKQKKFKYWFESKKGKIALKRKSKKVVKK